MGIGINLMKDLCEKELRIESKDGQWIITNRIKEALPVITDQCYNTSNIIFVHINTLLALI